MSEQEQASFQKILGLAQAALHARDRHDRDLRMDDADDEDSLHHLRYR